MADRVILTTYRVIPAGRETATAGSVYWPREPGFRQIADLVEPMLDGGNLEQVSVLAEWQGQQIRTDMFVDDEGILKGLPRNERATAIYRAAALARQLGRDPEAMQHIAGTVILFDRKVWF